MADALQEAWGFGTPIQPKETTVKDEGKKP